MAAIPRLATGYRALIALILVMAAVLRLWTLGRDDLWLDEIFSVWLVRQYPADIWRYLTLENHPPLYYLLLWLWVHVVGDGAITVRMLSVLFGVLTVVVIARTARRTFSPTMGLFAGALAAASPPLVLYAREARMYAPLAFFSALALDQALSFLTNRSRRSALCCAAVLSLALLTHYYALLLWLAISIGVLLPLLAERDKPALRRWLLANLLPAFVFALWLPVLWMQWQNNHGTHWLLVQPVPETADIFTFVAWTFGGASETDRMFLPLSSLTMGAGALAAVGAALLGAMLTSLRRAEHPRQISPMATADALFLLTLTTLLPVLIAFSVSQWKMIWQWKYLLGTVPALILLMSGLIFLGAQRRGAVTIVAYGLGGMLLVQAVTAAQSAILRPHWNQEWRGIATFLRQQLRPQDTVLVTQPDTLPPKWVCLEHFGVPRNQLLGVSDMLLRPADASAMQRNQIGKVYLICPNGDPVALAKRMAQQTKRVPQAIKNFDGITITVFAPPPAPRNESAAGASVGTGTKETKR